MNLLIDDDAFGDAQIKSKMVLADAIEHVFYKVLSPVNLDFYAGWYGVAPFLLLTRQRLKIGHIRSIDIDPKATEVAQRVNRHWMIDGNQFSAHTADVNGWVTGRDTHMVVNTSLEHMEKNEWFDRIPSGMLVALQGTNMLHENEVVPNLILSFDQLHELYPLNPPFDTVYWPKWSKQQVDFSYPGKPMFSRFMVIGRKP